MRTDDFTDNADETTRLAFDRLGEQYNVTKISPKGLRQDYVRTCLDTLGQVDVATLSMDEQEETLDMAVQLSTWAKRGTLRKRAILQIEALFIQTAAVAGLDNIKNRIVETLVQSNKPAHISSQIRHFHRQTSESFTASVPKP